MILKRLTQQEINKILSQKSVFERAQQITGVPWQAIAAIWYRESFSLAPPKRPGGQFQFDPPLTKSGIKHLLDLYTKLPEHDKEWMVASGQEHFQTAAILAACWLRHKAKPVLTPDSPDEHIKDAFYGYNGRAYGSAGMSPYVMNYFDEGHFEMRVYGTVRRPDGTNERLKDAYGKDGVPNKQIGAFVIYRQLRDLK